MEKHKCKRSGCQRWAMHGRSYCWSHNPRGARARSKAGLASWRKRRKADETEVNIRPVPTTLTAADVKAVGNGEEMAPPLVVRKAEWGDLAMEALRLLVREEVERAFHEAAARSFDESVTPKGVSTL